MSEWEYAGKVLLPSRFTGQHDNAAEVVAMVMTALETAVSNVPTEDVFGGEAVRIRAMLAGLLERQSALRAAIDKVDATLAAATEEEPILARKM